MRLPSQPRGSRDVAGGEGLKSNRVRLRQPAALAILLALGAGCREAGDPCTSTADCLDTERYREVCIDGVCREVCNSSQTCLPG